jgi:predicted metal-dependent HD superfamily phosphohydrolase
VLSAHRSDASALFARYGEAQRHYHTLKHIAVCLGWLATHASFAQRPAEIALALWFHDAVYDPRASDNEARSAELARERLGALGVGTEVTERIAAQILATREHLAAGDADTQLLLDIDLSILGASPERGQTEQALPAAVHQIAGNLADDAGYARLGE